MLEFLTTPGFKFGVLPIGSAVLGVGVNYISRNDQYAKFKKEDIAVGVNLTMTACVMFVVLTTDRAVQLLQLNKDLASALKAKPLDPTAAAQLQDQAQKLSAQIADSGWLIALMFLALWSISTLVRKKGWKSATEMDTLVGIAVPLAFGILSIILVMAGATR
jgi:hypothetical protein